MARADFYLIAKPRFLDDPLLLVCELAKRCLAAGKPTLILVRDAAQADLVDGRLWDFEEDAFIPHQIAGDEDDEETPVLIVTPDIDVPDRPYIINLRDQAFSGTCERVLEVVPPADPEARAPLRQRWRDYQARGFEVIKHDM